MTTIMRNERPRRIVSSRGIGLRVFPRSDPRALRSPDDRARRSVPGMSEKEQGQLVALQGSYLTPSLEHARVADAMRAGVISCPPDTSMEDVARIMASNHVHAVVVRDGDVSGRSICWR